MKKPILTLSIIASFLVCVVSSQPASAQFGGSVKNGMYIGAMFSHNVMAGDLDDSIYYYSDSSIYNVPDVDDGSGFALFLGTRMDRLSFEIGYQNSAHDSSTELGDIGDEATYNVLDFDLKLDIIGISQLRPYLLFGVGIPWLDIKDNVVNEYTGSLKDETFHGYCWNLGVGASLYLTPQMAVTAGIKSRWNTFGRVDDLDLDDEMKSRVVTTNLGMLFTF